jgi:hypothetical protein
MEPKTRQKIGIAFFITGTALILITAIFGFIFLYYGIIYGISIIGVGGVFFALNNTGLSKMAMSSRSGDTNADYSSFFKTQNNNRPSPAEKSKFCPYCGKILQDGSDTEFCAYCGRNV